MRQVTWWEGEGCAAGGLFEEANVSWEQDVQGAARRRSEGC